MKEWTFPSSSGAGSYRTILADDGKLTCNCKGWTMRRGAAPRHCKHTKQIAVGKTVITRGEFVYLAGDPGAVAARADVAPIPARFHPTGAPYPMLASAMTDPVTGAAFDARYRDGWKLEEKLDGHRCTVVIRRGDICAFSRPRAGAEAANARDLPAHVLTALRDLPDGIYDGELVAPGGKAWQVVVLGAQLVYVVFDVLALGDRSLITWAYRERRAQLLTCLASLPPKQVGVSTVESVAPSWKAIEAIWKRGGEGAILKRVDSRYTPNHRSPDWVKVKAKRAATLTLTGFAAGKSGPYSVMELRDADGVTTTVKTLGNHLLREISAAPDRYLGRRVVIAFQERTPGGTYRHGIFDHFAGDGE